MKRIPFLLSLLSLLAMAVSAAFGDAPALTYVFPPGARRGSTVTVTVGPKELSGARVWVEGEGISALGPVQEGKVALQVAEDAAPGVRKLRLVTAEGASVPRPFAVGVLPEALEVEPNNTPKEAQRLTLPVTVNGQISGRSDPDSFRVTLKAGECLVAAAEARRLGAPTDLVLRLLDARGVELATCEDYNDRDPLIACTVPADGDYIVEAYDVMTNYSTVNQDYTYRLTLTTGPYLDRALPPTVVRGATTAVTLTGWNLDGRSGRGSITRAVAVPGDAGRTVEVTAPGAPNALTLLTEALPVTLEVEPNDDLAHAQPVADPSTVGGALGQRGDVDVCRIMARAGERFVFDVDAQSLGAPMDGVLTLLDAQGKTLAESDDAEGRRDPLIRWTAPAEGPYYLRVRDVGTPARGGPEFLYRLHIDAPHPGLALALTDPSPALAPGEKRELALQLTRRDGAASEVEIAAEGLPAGVTADPVKVPAAPEAATGAVTTDVRLTLAAALDAAPGAAPIRLLARTKVGDQTLTAPAVATFPLATDRSGTVATGSTEQLLLVVRPKAADAKAGDAKGK